MQKNKGKTDAMQKNQEKTDFMLKNKGKTDAMQNQRINRCDAKKQMIYR